jgi:hypothetical protein
VLRVNLIDLPLPDSTRQVSTKETRGSDEKSAVLENVRYAATLWTEHLETAKHTSLAKIALGNEGQVTTFIRVKLLEWLECLSLLDSLPRGIKALNTLATVAEVSSVLDARVWKLTTL